MMIWFPAEGKKIGNNLQVTDELNLKLSIYNKMIDFKTFEVWFVTGSQILYGEETLKQVACAFTANRKGA